MSGPQQTIAQLRAARQSWVELEPAQDGKLPKRVQIIRPREAELGDMSRRPGETDVDVMVRCASKYVRDWDGITLAALLGDAIAPADPITFDLALWLEYAPDRLNWLTAVFEALADAVIQEQNRREASAKN